MCCKLPKSDWSYHDNMGSSGGRTVERYDYRSYIKSSEWRAKPEAYWASKLPKCCYVCAAPRSSGMHPHHLTYKNLGSERLMDLVPVCAACHKSIHEIHEEPGCKLKGLWYATKAARRRHEKQTHVRD